MCGISGFFDPYFKVKDPLKTINTMKSSLQHRGPDYNDIWSYKPDGIFISHSRLSIIDLSINGNQPMLSSCERYVITFNGEIYNFNDLKKEINLQKNIVWKSNSDTEVLLEAISLWGASEVLYSKLNGMYAFAIWDRKDKKLHIVRDNCGEKPLFYGYINDVFYFASELKAFNSLQNWNKSIDIAAATNFFRKGYISFDYSIYKDVKKLMPSSSLTISRTSFKSPNLVKKYKNKLINDGEEAKFLSKIDIIDKANYLITDSVKLRMLSDVPLGLFLSGGIDSSIIALKMQNNSKNPINTFTICFEDEKYNEGVKAKNISKFLGTNHHELILNENNLIDVVPSIMDIYDENHLEIHPKFH